MDDLELAKRIGLALALGLLIGVERGWSSREVEAGKRIAGVRTFTLIGLLGALTAVLGEYFGPNVVVAGAAGFCALVIVAYAMNLTGTRDSGLTTEVAALVTFALGLLCVVGAMEIAVGAAVIMAALLSAKERMHRGVAGLTAREVAAGIQLLLISVVALPLLPDRGFGPGGVLNPYRLWAFVVLIAGLSFVGYGMLRVFGGRIGLLLTAICGAIASSTAVTISLARRVAAAPALLQPAAAGTALASAVMFVRVLVITAVLNASIAVVMAPGLVAGALVAAAVGWGFLRRPRGEEPAEALAVQNPLELSNAVRFGVVLAVVLVAAEWLRRSFQDAGLYALALVSGMADVDAITVSVAGAGPDGLLPPTGAGVILVAVAANTVFKIVLAWIVGGRALGLRAGAAMGAGLAAGAVATLLTV